MTDCMHQTTRELGTYAYTGSVSRWENPAAHGNVRIEQECTRCGRRRSVLVNGPHEEAGPWGPSRETRQRRVWVAKDTLSGLLERRPAPTRLYGPGGDECRVAIDDEGYLLVEGDVQPTGEQISAALPELVEHARKIRRASIHLADAQDSM